MVSITLQDLLKQLNTEDPQLKLKINGLSGHALIQLVMVDVEGNKILSYDPMSVGKNDVVHTDIYLDPRLNRITLSEDLQPDFKKAEEKPVDGRQKMIDDGMVYYCLCCKKCYKEVPIVAHGCMSRDQCRHCPSDLFARLSDDSPA